jgi:hypothetical protein
VTRVLSPDEMERLRAAADRERELADRLLAENEAGEALLNEYARENGLPLPVDAETVDLADVARKKSLAVLYCSVLRKRLAHLVGESLTIDYGVSNVEYVPGDYDENGEGRPPLLNVTPDLAERFPFKSRKLRAIFKALPETEPTPAAIARRELEQVFAAVTESSAFMQAGRPTGPIDEAEVLRAVTDYVKDGREYLRRRQARTGRQRHGGPRPGSLRAADEEIARQLGFNSWSALQKFFSPARMKPRT